MADRESERDSGRVSELEAHFEVHKKKTAARREDRLERHGVARRGVAWQDSGEDGNGICCPQHIFFRRRTTQRSGKSRIFSLFNAKDERRKEIKKAWRRRPGERGRERATTRCAMWRRIDNWRRRRAREPTFPPSLRGISVWTVCRRDYEIRRGRKCPLRTMHVLVELCQINFN